jgi:hypothetical protein
LVEGSKGKERKGICRSMAREERQAASDRQQASETAKSHQKRWIFRMIEAGSRQQQ